jgi:glycosyltransferase involved in cell wall biosynthesis
MTRIAILTRTVTDGDAVGNDVLGMYQALAGQGRNVRIYAEGWTLTEPEVHAAQGVEDFLESASDLLIYHHSIGWDLSLELLGKLQCRTVIKYHNVTPPSFFAGVASDFEERCVAGREQLKSLVKREHDLYLSDSEYNMRELLEEGADPSRNFVLPPFHHIDLLDSIYPDLSVIDGYRTGRVNLLTVGRVSPNKDHVSLIEAFANYYYNYNSNSRLLIVGKQDEAFESYYQLLEQLISSLCLEEAVIFTGGVTDEALKAYYLTSHLFMITSEHEGFCVPLVEAMAMKLPILAYASSAIPGTVGEAGIVWDERNPLLMAEAIDSLLRDEASRAQLAEKGHERYRQLFTNQKIAESFLQVIGKLI